MDHEFQNEGYHPTPLLRAVQIFLLILIMIGIALLGTQNIWVPKVVSYIIENEKASVEEKPPSSQVVVEPSPRPDHEAKNNTYLIEGVSVTLKDGISQEETLPGSASLVSTGYFGNEVFTDLNADGVDDIVFLLTQETGGSGLFFYVVAAVSSENGYVGSSAYFLGDRIAPQTTEYINNEVVINYADRALGESFSVAPSVGKSVRLTFDVVANEFVVVEK